MSKKKQVTRVPVIVQEEHSSAARISIMLILLGLAISLYLLRLHYLLVAKQSIAGSAACTILGGDCESTLSSAAAVQFGLPLAGWGTIYFVTLFTLLLLGRYLKEGFGAQAKAAAFVITIPGVIVSAILLFTMFSGRAPFCPFCATIHGINFILFFSLKRQTGQSFGKILGSLFPGSQDLMEHRAGYLGYLAVALIAVIAYQWLVFREAKPSVAAAEKSKPQSGDLEKMEALLQSEEERQINVSADDPVLGPSSAPARIIVFSDYECPACRGYEPALAELKQSYGDQLQLVFKNFPLDKSCNPVVQRDLHLHACEAAFSAETARRQGKFWIYHDELFISDLDNPGVFDSIAQSVGLDMTRFQIDRHSEPVRAKVLSDINQGIGLGVNSTPSLYLNGRKILDVRPEVVHYLIDRILAEKK